MTQSRSIAGPRAWALLTLIFGFALASPFLRRSHQIGEPSSEDVTLAPSMHSTPAPPRSDAPRNFAGPTRVNTPSWSQMAHEVTTDVVEEPKLPSWAKPKSALDELIAAGAPAQTAFEMTGPSLKDRPTPTKELRPIPRSGLPATTPQQTASTPEQTDGSLNRNDPRTKSRASLAAAQNANDQRHSPWYHNILNRENQQRPPASTPASQQIDRSRASTASGWHTDLTPVHRRMQAAKNQERPQPPAQYSTQPGGLVSSPKAGQQVQEQIPASPPQFVYQPGLIER